MPRTRNTDDGCPPPTGRLPAFFLGMAAVTGLIAFWAWRRLAAMEKHDD